MTQVTLGEVSDTSPIDPLLIGVPSIWETMPSQALRRIFRFLKKRSLKDIRQVCSNWKEDLEHEVGLKVKIDDRIQSNIDFIKIIGVREARVLKLDDPVPSDLFCIPSLLRRLFLTGPISPAWFKSQLQNFENLTKLVLRGGFLTVHQLQENRDFSVRQPNSKIIMFPVLKSLEIVVNEFSYPFFLPLATRLRDPERAILNEINFNEMALKVAGNISYILTTIRSRALKMLQVYSYQKVGYLLPVTHNWRFHPLETFLEYHKNTIRDLYLPEFEGKQYMGNEAKEFPKELAKLSIMVSCFIGDIEQDRLQDSTYLKNLISSQTVLKAVALDVLDFTQVWMDEVLSGMCTNSRATLTYIELLIQMQDNFEFNCSMFQACNNLEILKLNCRDNEGFVTNFNALPSSLRKVRIYSCYIVLPAAEEVKKYTNLIMLEMSTLMLDTGSHEGTLAFIQAVLNLRNLNFVGINFNESAGNNVVLREIMRTFSLFYDPRFQYSGIKINYSYELTEGWSDEVLGEAKTDRDFINQREPEEEDSSPLALEDDPRIILFQNIPLLLGQIRGQGEDHSAITSGNSTPSFPESPPSPDGGFADDEYDNDDF